MTSTISNGRPENVEETQRLLRLMRELEEEKKKPENQNKLRLIVRRSS